jgi:hypothetical protein
MKKFLSLIWRGWKKFAHTLGVVNTKILLTITYFVMIALVSVFSRIFGADFLDKRMKRKLSYWRGREPVDASLDSCRHQF